MESGIPMKRGHPSVTVLAQGLVLEARPGEILADVLSGAGIPVSLYCRRRGVCGKCLVRVQSGAVSPPDEREAALLSRGGRGEGERLACRLEVRSDLAVEIPESSLLKGAAILETGIVVEVIPDPAVKAYPASLAPEGAGTGEDEVAALAASLGRPRPMIVPLDVLRELPRAAKNGPVTAVLHGDREVLDLIPGGRSVEPCGAAVDVGTSTVVIEVVELASGRSLGRASAVNAQAVYGADVVSRITAAFQDPGKLKRLQRAVVDQVNGLVAEAAALGGAIPENVYEVVVAGNTAMSHFFLGVDVDGLAVSPFRPVFSVLPSLDAAAVGLHVHRRAKLYLAPNIRSFVGGDIAAGLAATGLARRRGHQLFVDLGTNGEIVLKKGRELITTSTAAGPAFEGMSISCGMLAVPGAVSRVEWRDGFVLTTIGGGAPRGVCGTGLVDAVAIALRRGLIASDGRIASGRGLELAPGIVLTQQDVREVQLAVAAVKAGTRMMLRTFGLEASDLAGVVLAGAFGTRLDIGHAIALGLLPSVPVARVAFVGNASLAGAKKLLLAAPERKAIETLVGTMRHVSLAADPRFQDDFVAGLTFGPQGGEL
jgi:uncharacterized 2Fe-2S/4Fe-4S cluster protein (DUF4445 family)